MLEALLRANCFACNGAKEAVCGDSCAGHFLAWANGYIFRIAGTRGVLPLDKTHEYRERVSKQTMNPLAPHGRGKPDVIEFRRIHL